MQHVDFNAPGAFSYEQLLRTILRLDIDYSGLEEGFRRAVFNVIAINQDDHVKNIGFLMNQSGTWQLAPAFDLTFARGTGFTRRHQMSLNNKQDDFTRDDLLALGARAGLKGDGRAIIDQVQGALAQWPEFADEAGVGATESATIAGAFRFGGKDGTLTSRIRAAVLERTPAALRQLLGGLDDAWTRGPTKGRKRSRRSM